MVRLGVNIDHVATLRQQRKEVFPDPLQAAQAAVQGGADGITAHLREDRRHIQDEDIFKLKSSLSVPLNLEMAAAPEILAIAQKVVPAWCCLVPEKRQELTTEGGLDVLGNKEHLTASILRLQEKGIQVSLFVEPDPEIIAASKEVGADAVEIHTGGYSTAWNTAHSESSKCSGTHLALNNSVSMYLKRITSAAEAAQKAGLLVNAGHGLTLDNCDEILKIPLFNEFNIGFSLVARAVFVGLKEAVREMKEKIKNVPCAAS